MLFNHAPRGANDDTNEAETTNDVYSIGDDELGLRYPHGSEVKTLKSSLFMRVRVRTVNYIQNAKKFLV